MAHEKKPGDAGIPAPDKKLSKEEALVTVPDGDISDPTDLDFDGEGYDEERDGPIPDYPEWRIDAELNQAATTKEE
jgi:hypothetical protein